MERKKLIHLHSSVLNKKPDATALEYGELAVNYSSGGERLFLRNSEDKLVEFTNSSGYKYGCTNVTTLTNVPIKTRLIYASVSSAQELSIDITSFSEAFESFPVGFDMKIIAYNDSSSDITITLPTDDSSICFVKSLTVNSGGYGVITVDFKSQTEIYFDGKSGTQESSSYTTTEAIVAFSDGTNYKFINDNGTNLSDFKAAHSDYEPIGIVVIPASCSSAFYPEGDVRRGKNIIMSLVPMDCTTPDTGGTVNTAIPWGSESTETSLTNFTVVNYYSNGALGQSTISTMSDTYLPSDAFNSSASKVYPSIYYSSDEPGILNIPGPSPFKLVDGELLPNVEYYSTTYSSYNAFSDFAGPNNTNVLINLATSQTNWKTKGTAITKSTSAGYYPAACCCARFGAPDNSSAPKGTSSFLYHKANNASYDYSKGVTGVWYMPACGELGCIVPHRSMNDSAITKVKTLYNLTNASALESLYYYSSSEHNASNARVVCTSDGHSESYTKTLAFANLYVRAFCAVG